MNYLIVPLHSRTASFRDPEFQNFHRSLPLPPPATCIGLAGAALGLMPADAQAFFTEDEWQLGVAGYSAGIANDLWKFDDFKKGSILVREILYDNRFTLVFGHKERPRLEQLQRAFSRPVFALCLGPSDSICKVETTALYITTDTHEERELHQCYVAGDIVADSIRAATMDISATFSIRTTSLPVAQDLPVRFDYAKDGVRMLRQRRLLSYAQYPIKLPYPVRGIKIEPDDSSAGPSPKFVPLFPL